MGLMYSATKRVYGCAQCLRTCGVNDCCYEGPWVWLCEGVWVWSVSEECGV